MTTYSSNFNEKSLPDVRYVDRVDIGDKLPSLDGKRIAISVGAHPAWDAKLTAAVDRFCEKYGAVVATDHTSNYDGQYGILCPLVIKQSRYVPSCKNVDVMIHIGEISGAYAQPSAREVWRVSPDGVPRDTFGKLRYVFNMTEEKFFESYTGADNVSESASPSSNTYLEQWRAEDKRLRAKIGNIPFSNIWCAQQTRAQASEEFRVASCHPQFLA